MIHSVPRMQSEHEAIVYFMENLWTFYGIDKIYVVKWKRRKDENRAMKAALELVSFCFEWQ